MEKTNLKIDDLKENIYLGDYGIEIADYQNGYIADIISEIADSNVDIYYSDLKSWAFDSDHFAYIEQANNEMTDCNNIHEIIMYAEFLYNIENLHKYLNEILKYWALNYIEDVYSLECLDSYKLDAIEFINYENVETLEELKSEIYEILQNEPF